MERRTFLKTLPAISLLTGTASSLSAMKAYGLDADSKDLLSVRIDAPEDPLTLRTFSILKDRIEQRCSTKVVRVEKDPKVVLSISSTQPEQGFCIDEAGAAVRIAGGSPRGLLYGAGKFLRTSHYDGAFQPSSWRGTSIPQGNMRGMYFATHFHNWYHVAPENEITRYLEDLALWGVNALMTCVPFINLQDWNDPQAGVAIDMLKKYGRIARELGLQYGTGINNTLFRGAPANIRATPLPDPTGRRGNSGNPICPSNPEGLKYILDNAREVLKRLGDTGLDFLVHWPYDEGGCNCEQCRPWGSNGYLKLSREMTLLGREFFPEMKSVLSTWLFDTPPEGEWQGLTDALAKDTSWVDYILADSHEEFPRYPLEVGVPGHLPLLNFPEISMWGNSPWGGSGANPLPARFQRLWDQVKQAVIGGFPYSEGIYEDMNKAVTAQFYWNRDQTAQATLTEYADYEFGSGVAQDCLALVDILETVASCSYTKQPVDVQKVQRAYTLAEGIHNRLPEWAKKNWRWEILHLRAILDHEQFAGDGLKSVAAQAAMLRLAEIYHCQIETDDPYHHRVRPLLKNAVSRNGEI